MAVPLVDRSAPGSFQTLVLRVIRNPRALFFKQAFETPLVAWACGECGHVEIFAKEPQKLWVAYCESLRKNTDAG
jgi:hypothetical protein